MVAITTDDWNRVTVSKKVRYKSPSMTRPEATYEGTIVAKYDNYVIVNGYPLRETMQEKIFFGDQIPYNFCIPKNRTSSEKLWIEY